MIHIIFILIKPLGDSSCSVDGRDLSHQDRSVSSQDKGDNSEQLYTDLQWPLTLRRQVDLTTHTHTHTHSHTAEQSPRIPSLWGPAFRPETFSWFTPDVWRKTHHFFPHLCWPVSVVSSPLKSHMWIHLCNEGFIHCSSTITSLSL